MPGTNYFILSLLALVLLGACMVPAAATDTPFSFTVTPKTTAVKAGDIVNYSVKVTADKDFDAPIVFSMNFTIGEFSAPIPVETCPAPYPRTCIYTIHIPKTAPTGILANVVMTGNSGTYTYQEGALTIKTSGAQGLSGVVFNSVNAETREGSSIFTYFANQSYSNN
ncbi:MAG: hypothetical protein ABFC24_07610 [Methanoregulaceae archaeon]